MDLSITAEASSPAETLAEHPVALQTPPVVAQNPAGVANSSSEIISRRYPQQSGLIVLQTVMNQLFDIWGISETDCSLQVLVFSFFLKGKEV